jgi:hypothetical protein
MRPEETTCESEVLAGGTLRLSLTLASKGGGSTRVFVDLDPRDMPALLADWARQTSSGIESLARAVQSADVARRAELARTLEVATAVISRLTSREMLWGPADDAAESIERAMDIVRGAGAARGPAAADRSGRAGRI